MTRVPPAPAGRTGSFLRFLDRFEETLIAFLIAMSTMIIFVAVMQRYGLSMTASLAQWAKAQGFDWLAVAARWLFSVLRSFRFTLGAGARHLHDGVDGRSSAPPMASGPEFTSASMCWSTSLERRAPALSHSYLAFSAACCSRR